MSDIGYVIYLSSEGGYSIHCNAYGYWRGKTYTVDGEIFPSTDSKITRATKIYKRKVSAEKMADKLYDRCGYVMSWKVESYDPDNIQN